MINLRRFFRLDGRMKKIDSEEWSFEKKVEEVENWYKQNNMKFYKYPCGHIVCLITLDGPPLPEKCPFVDNHNVIGRAINP